MPWRRAAASALTVSSAHPSFLRRALATTAATSSSTRPSACARRVQKGLCARRCCPASAGGGADSGCCGGGAAVANAAGTAAVLLPACCCHWLRRCAGCAQPASLLRGLCPNRRHSPHPFACLPRPVAAEARSGGVPPGPRAVGRQRAVAQRLARQLPGVWQQHAVTRGGCTALADARRQPAAAL